jgi:site-specific recombinase XerD
MIKPCDPVLFHPTFEEKDKYMLEQTFVRQGIIDRLRRGPLGPHLDHFATSLHQQGYVSSSIQSFLGAAEKFAEWLQGRGYSVYEMDEDLLRDYLSGLTRHRSGNLPKAAQGLGHLVTFLRQQGATRPRLDGLSISPIDQWLNAYDAHLEQVAGLALSTRQNSRHLVRCFLSDCFGTEPPNWSSLTAAHITTFVSQEASMRRGAGRKKPAEAIRSFLRFLVFRGEIRPGLEAAAPSPPQWKYASLPSRLTPEEVERVLAVYSDGSAISLRNRAMLFLLARLGLRAHEVVSLNLDDMDWADGRFDLRPGKTRRARNLPLPRDVGQAIVTYLQSGRPQSESRQVFLQSRAPYRSLTGASVWAIARQAFKRAGIIVPPGVASHLFRHTIASQMVNHGASFKDVADVLGHQSIQTTGIYAKLELDTLAAVALPWEGGIL